MKTVFKILSAFFTGSGVVIGFWSLAGVRSGLIPLVPGILFTVYMFLFAIYSGWILGNVADGK